MGKYYWVPASIDSFPKAGSLAVKHKKKPSFDNHLKLTKIKTGYKLEMYDRYVYLIKSILKGEDRYYAPNADEILNLDMCMNPSLLKSYGLDYVMVNSSAISKKYDAQDFDVKYADHPDIISDSGGFQLLVGVLDFLNPKEVVERHNKVCDIGVVLDVPLQLPYHHLFLKRAALVQKRNTEVFLEHKRPSLNLMNVFHGRTLDLRNRYREVVEIDDVEHVAIAGMLKQDVFAMTMHCLNVMMTGKKYKLYHMLGISGLEKTILMAYMASQNLAEVITSDSSKHIQTGVNGNFIAPERLGATIAIGVKSAHIRDATFAMCSCDLCNMLKYVKPYILPGFNNLLVYHNLLVTKNQIDLLTEVAAAGPKETAKFVLQLTKKPELAKRVQGAMNMVDYAIDHGLNKTISKYSENLTAVTKYNNTSGLFHNIEPGFNDKEYQARTDKVLSGYEKFHGIKRSK